MRVTCHTRTQRWPMRFSERDLSFKMAAVFAVGFAFLVVSATFASGLPLLHVGDDLTLPPWHNPMEVPGLFEGDIVLDDRAGETLPRNAIRDHRRKWPDAIIPYAISSAFSSFQKNLIEKGMREFEAKTCLRFVERTNQAQYVNIMRGNGCYSKVGKVPSWEGVQDISLGNNCVNRRTIFHELMHAIGFQHEISRTDRDDYITILWDNIEDGQESNFQKIGQDEIDYLGEEYDFSSVLHYDSRAFAKNWFKPTIKKKTPGIAVFGLLSNLSEADIRKMNKLYCGLPIDSKE